MERLINEKLGISVSYDYDEETGIFSKVHFYDSDETEFEAYVMEDIEEYQDDIKYDFAILQTVENFEALVEYFFEGCGRKYTLENFKEPSDDCPILNFNGNRIQVFY